jgi:Fic family protein
MNFDRERPYNDLPSLPPPGELETRAVLKKAIAANRELAQLKGAGDVIPNQAILVNSIVLQEARLSSEIENIFTTNDEMYRALGEDLFTQAEPGTKEVLRYREALWRGFEHLRERPISTNLFVELMQIIKQTDDGIRRVPGTKIGNRRTGEALYTPPEGEDRLRDLLHNLGEFLHAADDLDPLVKLAIGHYQFEAIHPFTDGNGRTGRIVNILYLVEQGLLDLPVLYLSHYIIRNKTAYYEGLRRVTEEQAWEDWILYLLDAVEVTSRQTRERIIRVRDLMVETLAIARERAKKAASKEVVELIFEQPYCRGRFLEDRGLASRNTATAYLNAFADANILRRVKLGREVYYVNDQLMDLLSE